MGAPGDKRQVAILGGGAAGLAAAFELSEPELQDRVAVTVYQRGWRLGGKGASGRDARRADRIEEHGLHIWFGFYRNALRLMKRCYAENAGSSGARTPFRRLDDAFEPCEELVLFDRDEAGWRSACLPLPDAQLGDPDHALAWMSKAILDWLALYARELVGLDLDAGGGEGWSRARSEAERMARAKRPDKRGLVAVGEQLAQEDGPVQAAPGLGFAAALADFWGAFLYLIADRVLPEYERGSTAPFDQLNGIEFREALRSPPWPYRVRETTLEAPFVRVLYDLAFAYVEGDPERPDLAAGVTLENVINILFRHEGGVMQKMRSGMGDAIFAPLHEALERRGVRFEFFHSVREIVAGGGGRIERVRIARQARIGAAGYDPLRELDAEAVWPNEPRVELLEQTTREAYERTRDAPAALEREHDPLDLGEDLELAAPDDFDHLICAIPVGALDELCPTLKSADPSFAEMVDEARPVATQALQLWLARGRSALGWPCRSADGVETIAGNFAKPFDTFCDMTHLLPRERWRAEVPVHLAYMCGVYDHRDGIDDWRAADDRAAANARTMLREHFELARRDGRPEPPFWENLRGEDLIDPGGGRGWNRAEGGYFRANSTPWERYSTSHHGYMAKRLRPEASGFANLSLAGDWTYTAVNAGSVEAAVMSGIGAAAGALDALAAPGPRPQAELPSWRRPRPGPGSRAGAEPDAGGEHEPAT